MHRIVSRLALLTGLAAAFVLPAFAQVPAPPAPSGVPAIAPTPAPAATPKAKRTRRTKTAPTPAPAAPPAPDGKMSAATPAPSATPKARKTRTRTTKSDKTPTIAKTPAHPGDVWVNTDSGVYHLSGTKWYGKTKEGTFMSESDAKAKGYHVSKSKMFGREQ